MRRPLLASQPLAFFPVSLALLLLALPNHGSCMRGESRRLDDLSIGHITHACASVFATHGRKGHGIQGVVT